jgi:hypothetical protein
MSSQASDKQQFYPEMAKLLEAGTRLARMAAGEEAGTLDQDLASWGCGDLRIRVELRPPPKKYARPSVRRGGRF